MHKQINLYDFISYRLFFEMKERGVKNYACEFEDGDFLVKLYLKNLSVSVFIKKVDLDAGNITITTETQRIFRELEKQVLTNN